MNRLRLFVLVLILGTWDLRADNGWISLFNGTNLHGWTEKTGDAKFYVEDGCIVGEAVSESDTNSVLCAKKKYGNFILELDFKADYQIFSGVHIRSQYAAKNTPWHSAGRSLTIPAGRMYGYLVLIDPSPNHRWWTATLYDQRWWTGGIYDELRRLWLYPGMLGGNGNDFSEQGIKTFNLTNWNHLRIEAVGDSIKTYLNGEPRADIHDSMALKGFIGLQVRDWISDDDHQTLEGAKVRFKNIRLLPVSPPSKKADSRIKPPPAAVLSGKLNRQSPI